MDVFQSRHIQSLSFYSSLFNLNLLRLFWFSSLCFAVANNSITSKAFSTTQQCFHDHFSALLQLKQGFQFDTKSTTVLSSWNPDERNCCYWEGVTCNEATGHVIGLDLSNRLISGQIDFRSLFRIYSLQKLNLGGNDFDLRLFPSGFGQLKSLSLLNLAALKLYGQIPQDISTLTNLISLDLSYNKGLKSPNIGTLVQNLTSLRELCLDRVDVRGESFSLPPSLRKLSLANCGLSAPNVSFLSKLPFLHQLDLSRNNFSSGFLAFSIPRLRGLSLSGCGISASTHFNLSQPHSLSKLDLSFNKFSAGLPALPLPQLRKLSLSACGISTSTHFFLSQLHFLSELDLSSNDFATGLPDSVENFSSITQLDLNNCSLQGGIPESISRLPNLQILNMQKNPGLILLGFPQNNTFRHLTELRLYSCSLSGPLPTSLANLSKLVHLDLSENNFRGKIPSCYGDMLLNLRALSLRNNSLTGTIPLSLFSLPSLKQLDLGSNLLGGQLSEFQNASSSALEDIYLQGNNLHGLIPKSLIELPKLTTLFLSNNNFSGTLDMGLLQNASSISFLDLSNNSFSGTLPSSLVKLNKLSDLNLAFNNFSGLIPSSLFSLPSLRRLDLNSNLLDGQLDEFQNASSSLLDEIRLDGNNLQGMIPRSIFKLSKLGTLFLSANNFSDLLDIRLLQNLRSLTHLDLSGISLSIDDDNGNLTSISFPRLNQLSLRSCNIGKFPKFLQNHEELMVLDLSNNRIKGDIPKWIWKLGFGSFWHLNLSHNALEGIEGSIPQSSSAPGALDFSYNMLKGSLPIPPPGTTFFSASNNSFSGKIPSLICNVARLQVLDLSGNNLSGQIPQCLGGISGALNVLNLRGNAFNGTLYHIFEETCSLQTLDLSENRLEGQIPRSLTNCNKLQVLNLGNNQMHDNFPPWLATLSELRILILRANMFYGSIEHLKEEQNFLPQLQIFDLSSNNFTGSLPSNIFQNWKGMMEVRNSQFMYLGRDIDVFSSKVYYQDTVTVIVKGKEMELAKILTIFTSIDLSNNRFHGSIPEVIGNLKSLILLNMSHNDLTGHIPMSFKNLLQLESLDLSQNKLSGEIPGQLTDLTFLAVLNLSQNCLQGRIPQSQQFLTFSNESFLGNVGLCGQPLSKECNDAKGGPPPTAESESKYDRRNMWIGFGIGHGVGLGLFCWILVLWNRGRRVYYNFIDRMFDRFFPHCLR